MGQRFHGFTPQALPVLIVTGCQPTDVIPLYLDRLVGVFGFPTRLYLLETVHEIDNILLPPLSYDNVKKLTLPCHRTLSKYSKAICMTINTSGLFFESADLLSSYDSSDAVVNVATRA